MQKNGLKFSIANKKQSETADFAPVLPPGELDETCASFLILAHWLHYVKTRRHPQNRKYITYCIVVRGRPIHGYRYCNMYGKVGKIWLFGLCFLRCDRTDKQTERQTDTGYTYSQN